MEKVINHPKFGLLKFVYNETTGSMREYELTEGKWDLVSSTNILHDIKGVFPDA